MKTTITRIYALLILLISLSNIALAQGETKLYTSITNEKGILYYVKPQKMVEQSGTTKAISCDFTHLDSRGEVRFLFTLQSANALKTQEAEWIDAEGNKHSYPLSYLYRTPKSKVWINRIEIIMTYELWKQLFSQTNSPLLGIETSEGAKLSFSFKPSQWKKLLPLYTQMFNVIELNREGDTQQ